LHVDLNQCEATPNPYKLRPIKRNEEQNISRRGIVFGNIYGGIIYPPNQAQYYPTAIVAVVVFGPVFAQSWFIGPSGVIVWFMQLREIWCWLALVSLYLHNCRKCDSSSIKDFLSFFYLSIF